MRIIAGRLGGRTFDAPRSSRTHPMSDKMRGALFNVLGDIEGLSVLDPFAGSGALSFEAASRGAVLVTALDSDRTAQKTIEENITQLGLGKEVKLIKASAGAWLQTAPGDVRFDLILCDPPYSDLQSGLIPRLSEKLRPTGILVLSWPPGQPTPDIAGMHIIEHRHYGDSTLHFYMPYKA